MQDYEKIAAVQEMLQDKEAAIGLLRPLVSSLGKAGKWAVKHPLKSGGAVLGASEIAGAARRGAKGATQAPLGMRPPRPMKATF